MYLPTECDDQFDNGITQDFSWGDHPSNALSEDPEWNTWRNPDESSIEEESVPEAEKYAVEREQVDQKPRIKVNADSGTYAVPFAYKKPLAYQRDELEEHLKLFHDFREAKERI